MAGRPHTLKQIIAGLREAEVALAQWQPVAQGCRALGVTEQTHYRWRREMWRRADHPGQAVQALGG